MDADRFDARARLVTVSPSRRHILGFGLSFTVATLVAPGSEAKNRKKKCKKTCGPCKKCRKGKCRNTSSSKEACGGKCLPLCVSSPELATERNPLTCECCVSNGQSPGGNICLITVPCCSQKCDAGTCVPLEQGEACDFDAQCESGSCVLGECA